MAESQSEPFQYRAPLAMEGGEMVRASLGFTIKGVKIETSVPVPKGKTTLRVMLPVLRGFTEAFVHAAEQTAATMGKAVSCKAHCAACCRQLVPISEAEAYQLRTLIEALPEERRKVIVERFAAAKEQLQSTGEWERIKALHRLSDEIDMMELASGYFAQHVACPFLEEESCSIHPERPLACREYLVANDPRHCADWSTEGIDQIHPVAHVSNAVAMTNDDPPGTRGRYVPLVMLLDWTAEHPEPAGTQTGPELLREVMSQLLKTRLPAMEG